ncbi:MAG: GntR family transcriptional regulator [Thermodesulfobacteriota bacterium]|jgi:DNA-binding GntR family transcriptional regulator|nr:GntR family transcriptional regulator [Thermodesulfobacteriota bacterium]
MNDKTIVDNIYESNFDFSDYSLSEQAYFYIKKLFYSQKLIPSQKILYTDLANQFGMSRTPVINALGRLEKEGYVNLIKNRGYFVSQISMKEAINTINARELIETYCIEQSANNLNQQPNIKDIAIKKLEKAHKAYDEYRPESYNRRKFFLDRSFHLTLSSFSDNDVLLRYLADLFEEIYLRYPMALSLATERYDSAQKEHSDLVGYVLNGDISNLMKAIKLHYEKVRFYLFESIKKSFE